MALADMVSLFLLYATNKISLSRKCTRKIVATATNDLREACSLIIITSRVHLL